MQLQELNLRRTLRHLLITTLLLASLYDCAKAYLTEKVIVVMMGSVRNMEVFEDSTHQYIPRIWENVRPYGVLYNNFYTMAYMDFDPGMCSAIMGTWWNENKATPYRGLFPAIFEYYRKDLSAPQDKAWALIGNWVTNGRIDYSHHPAYGESYAASLWQNPVVDDREVLNEAIRVMNIYEPSLMVLEFVEPDVKAQEHLSDPEIPDSVVWQDYTNAIMQVDSLTDLLWTKIQIDPAYAGKTALFITDLHGRHRPEYGSFEWHGDGCEGCRRVPFLAVGPDFKAGETVDVRGNLVDICPTIGELLSFEPVFSQGRILSELFITPPERSIRVGTEAHAIQGRFPEQEVRLSPTGIHSHLPGIQAVGDLVHVIWTQQDPSSAPEAWDVMYTRSSDGGSTWDVPMAVFTTEDPTRKTISAASLSGDSAGIGIVTSLYKWEQFITEDSAWVWGSECKVSPDGSEWPQNSTNILRDKQLIVIDNVPAMDFRDSTIVVTLVGNRHTGGYKTYERFFLVSPDQGMNWFHSVIETEPDSPTKPTVPSAVLGDGLFYVESLRYTWKSRLPFFASEGSEIVFRSLVDDISDHEAFFPQLASGGDSTVFCVWSDDRDGHWEVYFSRSEDAGRSWSSNVRLSQGGVNTWHTAIEAEGDTLLVVWEDYRDGASSLYKRVSFDGGVHWSQEYVEEAVPGISTSPRLAHSAGKYYMVWQDYRGGEWEVYFKEVDIDVPVGIDEGDPSGDPSIPRVMELSQNYPNPFNPRTVITFDVPGLEETRVTLGVYDLRGSLVKELVDKPLAPGHYELVWDGTDHKGSDVASGIYLYTIDIKNEKITRKMTLAR